MKRNCLRKIFWNQRRHHPLGYSFRSVNDKCLQMRCRKRFVYLFSFMYMYLWVSKNEKTRILKSFLNFCFSKILGCMHAHSHYEFLQLLFEFCSVFYPFPTCSSSFSSTTTTFAVVVSFLLPRKPNDNLLKPTCVNRKWN